MFDFSDADSRMLDFFAQGSSLSASAGTEHVYLIPNKARFLYIVFAGAGGGGGGGFSGAAGTARGGGGGGGTASTVKVLVPVPLLNGARRLYARLQGRTPGGAAGAAAVSSNNSWLYLRPSGSTLSIANQATIAAGSGLPGSAGTGSAGGLGGGNVSVTAIHWSLIFALSVPAASTAGGAQTGAAGGAISPTFGSVVGFTGGTGGAGVGTANTDFAGGAITPSVVGSFPAAILAGGLAGGGRGQHGIVSSEPHFYYGGTGGGSNGAAGVGGAGGDGAIGCGGGGGGAGVTGGAGGAGGPAGLWIYAF